MKRESKYFSWGSRAPIGSPLHRINELESKLNSLRSFYSKEAHDIKKEIRELEKQL